MRKEAIIQRSVALYSLDTRWGRNEVAGTTNLFARINEFDAIEALENMQRSEVYKEALKKAAKSPLEGAKGLIDEPVDTVKNAAKGLGGFPADVGHSVVSRDPNQDNAAKTALGFATAKRQLAYNLGVNPYSSFEPLQDALSEVAWTTVGGSLSVTAVLAAVPKSKAKTAVSVLKITNTGRMLVRDNSPRKLKKINEKMLKKMGIRNSLRERLLDNFNYDPEAKTRLITALSSLKGVNGRDEFVKRAAVVTTRTQANLMRDWAELILDYHARIARVKRIVLLSSAPFVIDDNGELTGVFPTDYATWTPAVEGRVGRLGADIRSRGLQPGVLWFTGKIDSRVAKLLLGYGWRQVRQNAETTLRGG